MRGPDLVRVPRARALRRAQTEAEKLLWSSLRAKRLSGFKFVRQEPIGPFFADFVCRDKRLIVEVDGATHSSDTEIAYDRRRDGFLRAQGYRVIRMQNDDVFRNRDGVLDTILAALEGRS